MEKTIQYITEHLEDLRGDYICVSNVHTTVMAYRDETPIGTTPATCPR